MNSNNTLIMPCFNKNIFPFENKDFLKKLEEMENTLNIKIKSFEVAEKDLETIKKDRAKLNKILIFLKTGKKVMRNAWLENLFVFEKKLENMIDRVEGLEKEHAEKVKEEEKEYKKNKTEAIRKYFYTKNRFGKIVLLSFGSVLEKNEKWLNKTYTEEKIKTEIDELFEKLDDSLCLIEKENLSDGLKKLCKIKLFETLSLEEALKETYSFAEKLCFLDEIINKTK